jgi:hypothetical protein
MSEGRDPVAAAERALKEGRAWEARDRLAGCLGHRPDDLEIQSLLGDAWWQLGEHAQAGRWWFLTDRYGPDVDDAIAAFRQARSAVDVATLLRLSTSDNKGYAPRAADRMAVLAADVQAEGGDWPPLKKSRKSKSPRVSSGPIRRVQTALVVIVLLALTVGVWIVGIAAISSWLA